MACAWLMAAGDGGEDGAEPPPIPRRIGGDVDDVAWRQVAELVAKRCSVARDDQHGPALRRRVGAVRPAAAVNYEGQAAVELEAACDPDERGRYPIGVDLDGATLVIDPRETIRAVADDIEAGADPGVVASRFHTTMAAVTVEACSRAARSPRHRPNRAVGGRVPEPAPARGRHGRACARPA